MPALIKNPYLGATTGGCPYESCPYESVITRLFKEHPEPVEGYYRLKELVYPNWFSRMRTWRG
ncbi:MAG: hypothetical protein Q8J64_06235 [Thermodesulfovibrionales bacterium]|nr:hypothetical protein [Thermodesulfovibrionales bacterium]